MERLIADIKFNFRTEISNNDPKKTRLSKLAFTNSITDLPGNMLFESEAVYGKGKTERNLAKNEKMNNVKLKMKLLNLKKKLVL